MRTTLEDFIERAREVHGNRYDYSKVKYETTEKKVIIICKEHGEFPMRPRAHYADLRGCPECEEGQKSGFSYNSKWAQREKTLYFVEIKGNDENFLKIGVTEENDLIKRFQKGQLPYPYQAKSIDIIRTKKASELERILKEKFEFYSYVPQLRFRGNTECYKIKAKTRIRNEFKKIKSSI